MSQQTAPSRPFAPGVPCRRPKCSAGGGRSAPRLAVLGAASVLVTGIAPAAAAKEPPSFTLQDARIDESSGLAASRAHPGVYWTHNDSNDGPYVYAVDGRTGETVATVTMSGVRPRDVEAVSVGPEGSVYVADIGDNKGGTWSEVWIYRFPEPEHLRDTTVAAGRYTVRYADGPRDAESLMVHPGTGRVYIATKEKSGGALYAGPEQLSSSGVNTFRRVEGGGVMGNATDAAFSPDGSRLLVRSYFTSEMYRWTGGAPERLGPVAVPFQGQGESVTFTRDGRYLMCGAEGAHSKAEPVELEGEMLPDDLRAQDEEDTGGGAESGNGGKSPDSSDGNREVTIGGGVFVLAMAIWLVLRRVVRRRD